MWSVIIPARNEEKHIGTCLESLCRLRFELSRLEVIVADNGSSDRTIEIAQAYRGRLDIKIIRICDVAVGCLRNMAARQAQGRFLAFIDADCEVTEDWLQHATDLIDSCVGVIGAPYELPPRPCWPARVWACRFEKRRSGQVSFVPAGNLLIASSAFWDIGGFNELIRSNEDVEFCCRARSRGFEVVADTRLSVIHHGAERSLRHFARRQFWHGSGVLNPIALKANSRAIGLAGYALACVCAVVISAWLHSAGLLAASVAGLFIPALTLTITREPWDGHPRDAVLLFILIVTYSLARAAVLPVAAFQAFYRTSRRLIP